MKVSLIVAVYQNIKALELIITSLKKQTYNNFELIVAEDGSSSLVRDYLATLKHLNFKIIHTTQDDIGLRKARSQNNGILASTAEYLIFIDGDCIPYSTFIEAHVLLSEKNTILSGRRVNLNQQITTKILNNTISLNKIEKNYLKYFSLMFDKSVKYEQGIYLNPNKFLYKFLLKNKKRNLNILGCNFSCFKKDFLDINGFDEGYGGTALSDDTDLDWRFQENGLKLKSCKNAANVFHLWHKVHDRGNPEKEIKLMKLNKKKNIFICKKGLNTH